MTDEPSEPDVPIEDVIEPQPTPKPPPMDGNGKGETITDQVRKARDVIPVGDRGITPQTYAQWIDVAKDVSRATLMLPSHLHNNAPVMAGLLEIAARFQLSAYMLASQTYVQNNRLCFQAQAFGAILYASGLLRGRLRFEFHGEGDERTCTVSGVFRDDPGIIYSATTPTLKELHPGYSQKDGKTYVKGSPLWDKDAEQQMAYFAERRWIRRYAPDACMGMYTREEIMELDEYRAGREGAIPLTSDRLGQLDTGEGWQEGTHVQADMAAIEPDPMDWPREPEPPPPPPASKAPRPARRKAARAIKPVHKGKGRKVAKTRPAASVKARPRSRPLTRGEVKAAVDRAEHPPRRAATAAPRWLDYVTQAEAWIKAVTDGEAAEKRWEGERDQRDRAQVPMGERSRLRSMLDRKLAQLNPRKVEE